MIALGYMVLTALTTCILWTLMSKENTRRDAVRVTLSVHADDKGSDEWASGWEGEDEVARRRELGDRHPAWRYRV